MFSAEWLIAILFLNILVLVNVSKYPSFFDEEDIRQLGLGQNPYNANPSASLSRMKPPMPKRDYSHPPGYAPDPYQFEHPSNLPANAMPPHRAQINPALRGDPTDQDIVQLVENAQAEKVFPADNDGFPDAEDEMNLDKLPERLTKTKKWGEFRSLLAEESKKHRGEVMENWEEDAHKWAGYSRHLLERAAHAEKMSIARQAAAAEKPLGHPNAGMNPYWSEDTIQKKLTPAPPSWSRRNNLYPDSNENDYEENDHMNNLKNYPRMYYRGDKPDFVQNGRVSHGADEQEDYMKPWRGADHMPELDYENFKKANILNNPQIAASASRSPQSNFQGGFPSVGSISPESIYQGSFQQGPSSPFMNPLSIPGPGSEKDFPNGYLPHENRASDQALNFRPGTASNGGSYLQAKQLMIQPRAAPDIPMENIPPPSAKAKPQENSKSALRMGADMGPGFGENFPQDVQSGAMSGGPQHGAGNMLRTGGGPMQRHGPGGSQKNAYGMTPADFFGRGQPGGGTPGGGMPGGGMPGGGMPGGGMPDSGMPGGGMPGGGMPGGGMGDGGMPGGGIGGGGMSGISADAIGGYPSGAMPSGAMNGYPSGGPPMRGPGHGGIRPGPGAEGRYPNGYRPSYGGQQEEGPKGMPNRDMGYPPDYNEGHGEEPEYGQLPRNLPKRFHQGLDTPDYPNSRNGPPVDLKERSVGVRGKRPVYTGFPTGNKLANIAKQKLMALNQMDPRYNEMVQATITTERALTKDEDIANLRQYDDFKAPIRWVKFNSPDTRDGLARVTDELTHNNQQFIIEGELYVPIIDEDMARLGWTTEPPYVTTTAAPVAHQDEAALRVVMRSMELNATDQRDWLVFETVMGSQGLHEPRCDGESCQARCQKLACESLCRGDTCGAGCIGSNCNTFCKGPGCSAMCIGEQCSSKCAGLSCESRCWGNGCTAECQKFSCQRSENGKFYRSNSTWDHMYPQNEMEQNQLGMQPKPPPDYGNKQDEEYYE